MDKRECSYFYQMYSVIMNLLQSNNSGAVVRALNDANLNIGECYKVYCKSEKDNIKSKQ